MSRPRLLDAFCKAGGAGEGYSRAGFDVLGVDIVDQPNYPFEFVRADALAILEDYARGFKMFGYFDAIHASPPCKAFTDLKSMSNAREHEDLIAPTRELLQATGLPYVIENVPGAPLHEPFQLCGSSFGLGVPSLDRELRRHRLFETNWPAGLVPACAHYRSACGVYGDHFRLGRRSSVGEFSGPQALAYGSEAMGIDWMTWPELTQAIPPAYTEHIGAQLLEYLGYDLGDVEPDYDRDFGHAEGVGEHDRSL